MVVHTGEKRFQCEICHKLFAYKRTLTSHSKLHKRDKDFDIEEPEDSCTMTNTSTAEEDLKEDLNEEVMTDIPNQSSGTEVIQVTPVPRNTTTTAQQLVQDSVGRYICPHCPQVFLLPQNLQEHLETHTDLNNVTPPQLQIQDPIRKQCCTHCNMYFKHPYELRRHMVVHTGDKPYECDICHKLFAYKTTLFRHRWKLHKRYKDFDIEEPEDSCTMTNTSTAEEDLTEDMNEQVLTDIPNQSSKGEVIQVTPVPRKRNTTITARQLVQDSVGRYICPHCPTVFLMAQNLQDHLETHTHQDNKIPHNSKAQDRVQCPHCNMYIKTSLGLRRHMVIHMQRPTFQCLLCNASFKTRRNLSRHCKLHEDNNFCCKQCSLSFTSKVLLKQHVIKTHKVQKSQSQVEVDSTKYTTAFDPPIRNNATIKPKSEPTYLDLDAAFS